MRNKLLLPFILIGLFLGLQGCSQANMNFSMFGSNTVQYLEYGATPTPTPSPSLSIGMTPTPSPTPSPTFSPTPTPSAAPSATPQAPVIQFTDMNSLPRTSFSILNSNSGPSTVGSAIYVTRTSGDTSSSVQVLLNVSLATTSTNQLSPPSNPISITLAANDPSPAPIDISSFGILSSDVVTGDTYFVISLLNPSYGAIGSASQAQVNLIDQNYTTTNGYGGGGDIFFSSPFYSTNSTNGWATLILQRAFNTDTAETVNVSFADGVGVAGTDYDNTPITVQFSAGVSERPVNVQLPYSSPSETNTTNTSFYAFLQPAASPASIRGSGAISKIRIINTDGSACDSAMTPFGGGTGSSTDPYLICSATQWGSITSYNQSQYYFKLMADFNSSLHSIVDLNTNIDGNQYVIYNYSSSSGVPLIGQIIGNVFLQNINMLYASVTSSVSSASGNLSVFVGQNGDPSGGGILSDDFVSGYLASSTTQNYVGMLVGQNNPANALSVDISRGMSAGLISYPLSTGNVGGILGGENWTSSGTGTHDITNSYSTANINTSDGNGSNSYGVGGIAGYVGSAQSYAISSANYTNNQATGFIQGIEDVGGIIGYFEANNGNLAGTTYSVTSNTFSGSLVSSANNEGGIVGWVNAASNESFDFSNSTNNGSVANGSNFVGGILGQFLVPGPTPAASNDSLLMDQAVNTGNVSGRFDYVGGLIGYIGEQNIAGVSNDTISITNSFSSGAITGSSNTGGLIGELNVAVMDEVDFDSNSASGNITGINNASFVGGLIGSLKNDNSGVDVENDFYLGGNVTGYSGVGGFAGDWESGLNSSSPGTDTISLCGSINAIVSAQYNAGGFIGNLSSDYSAAVVDVSQSFVSNVNVSSTDGPSGGFYGTLSNNGSTSNTSQCYASGSVSSNSGVAGGFVGNVSGASTISDVYTVVGLSGAQTYGFANSSSMTAVDSYYLNTGNNDECSPSPCQSSGATQESSSTLSSSSSSIYNFAGWDDNFSGSIWIAPNRGASYIYPTLAIPSPTPAITIVTGLD